MAQAHTALRAGAVRAGGGLQTCCPAGSHDHIHTCTLFWLNISQPIASQRQIPRAIARMASTMQLRPYQKRIVETATEKNTIVVLPTGAGKTLIAAALALRLARPTSGPSRPTLFLVPTRILVTQQAVAIREWSGLDVAEYMGGTTLATEFDVLVSTPSAFAAAMPSNSDLLGWANFGLVVFDEVHHVRKEHPYRTLAKGIPCTGATPRILGLSASVTYAVGAENVATAVNQLCDDLRIDTFETATEAELVQVHNHSFQLLASPRLQLPSHQSTLSCAGWVPRVAARRRRARSDGRFRRYEYRPCGGSPSATTDGELLRARGDWHGDSVRHPARRDNIRTRARRERGASRV